MSEWIYDTVNVQHDVSGTTVHERIEYYYDSETGEIKDEVAEAIAARDAEWVAALVELEDQATNNNYTYQERMAALYTLRKLGARMQGESNRL